MIRKSKLGLGTVQFGMPYGVTNDNGIVSSDEVSKVIELAKVNGVRIVDTAICYGDAEEIIGKVGVGSFDVVTKIPKLPENLDSVRSWLEIEAESSLRRLRINGFYALLVHHPSDLLGKFGIELVIALRELQKQGLTKLIGVSLYHPDTLRPVMDAMSPEIVQIPVNLFDQRYEKLGILKLLAARDIEVHSRSTFLQGLLLLRPDELPPQFATWKADWVKIQRYLNVLGSTQLEACMSYPTMLREVSKIIVGVQSYNQMSQILEAAKNPFPFDWSPLSVNDEQLIDPSKWPVL